MEESSVHGVDAEYVAGMRRAGYDKRSIEDLVRTRIHGASPAYVGELRAAGYAGLSIEDIVRTRIHGATPQLAQEVKSAGYDRLAIDDLVKMRIHGVTPALIREMRELGYAAMPMKLTSQSPRGRTGTPEPGEGARPRRLPNGSPPLPRPRAAGADRARGCGGSTPACGRCSPSLR